MTYVQPSVTQRLAVMISAIAQSMFLKQYHKHKSANDKTSNKKNRAGQVVKHEEGKKEDKSWINIS